MTTNEPTEIGTVMSKPGTNAIAVLAQPDASHGWRMWDGARWMWVSWQELLPDNWTLVHRGYAPPIQEPTGKGAVVLSATGYIMHAIDDPIVGQRQWQYADGSGRLFWGQLAQPARELFAGVES